MSRFWRTCFRLLYRVLALLDPLIRAVWHRYGIGNVTELLVAGRNGQPVRSRMIGILLAGGQTYIGHPDGDSGWTRDLREATNGTLRYFSGGTWRFRATLLEPGSDEREAAIQSTGQHPFPGNLIYRLARGHVRATGVYFRLDDATDLDHPGDLDHPNNA
jgi:hypothetical protein